jgi:hypothetical protein
MTRGAIGNGVGFCQDVANTNGALGSYVDSNSTDGDGVGDTAAAMSDAFRPVEWIDV